MKIRINFVDRGLYVVDTKNDRRLCKPLFSRLRRVSTDPTVLAEAGYAVNLSRGTMALRILRDMGVEKLWGVEDTPIKLSRGDVVVVFHEISRPTFEIYEVR